MSSDHALVTDQHDILYFDHDLMKTETKEPLNTIKKD